MRFEPGLSVAAAASWLPPQRESVPDAVAAGRLDEQTAAEEGYLAVTVSETLAPPEMAVRAATDALATAAWNPTTVDLLVHAWTYYQGHDFWSPAHFVASGAGAWRAAPVGVQQMCNGGAAGIEIAATRLLADPAVRRAVVTTADRFVAPGFDRWLGDYGVAYGDGATALLLSATQDAPAPLRLVATVTVAVPELEAMHRGPDAFGTVPHRSGPHASSGRLDIRRTVRHFFGSGGQQLFADHAARAVHGVLAGALAEARVDGDDPRLRVVALPRLGRSVLDKVYLPAVASRTRATVLDLGRDTGHLGAGDTAANLADIHAAGLLAPGELAVLLSVGAGFTWSALVVQAL